MSGETVTLEQARAAKKRLHAQLAGIAELRGIGVMPLASGYAVKVNLATHPETLSIPSEIDGVRVIVDVIGSVKAL